MKFAIARGRAADAVVFAVSNVPVSLVVMWPLLHRAVAEAGRWSATGLLMFAASAVALNVVVLVAVVLLAVVRVPRWGVAGVAVAAASVLQLFLVADVRIFAFFKFHLNGLILNFLTTEGAGDSLKLGTATWVTFAGLIVVVIAGEVWLARRVWYRAGSFVGLRRRAGLVAAALVALVAADKAVYAYADLTNNATIMSGARFFLLSGGVTMKHLAERWFGYKINREKEVSLGKGSRSLNYPRQPLTFAPDGARYNVVFMLADGFRYDMLNAEVTPHLTEFARQHLTFKNHFSGGNGTRFGVFSMMYGLDANLWHPFLAARQSPVLIDALSDRQYQFSILCSTRLTFPEFRKTAFVRIPDSISDEWTETQMCDRDAALVRKFHEFLEQRVADRPFFAFIFFNSSHPFYQYPKAFEKFMPVVGEDINYMGDIGAAKAEGLKNRYKNALYYTDTLFQQVFDDLQAHGALDKTIVVVTGDHGEEFNENGYYSHNSAFDDYQTKTTMVMSLPGESAQTVTNLTSHLDLAPTVLGRLGCRNAPADYSHGRDILSSKPRAFVFCSDWDKGAIVTPQWRAVVPVSGGRINFVELRTAQDYRRVDDNELLRQFRRHMLTVATDLAAFLK